MSILALVSKLCEGRATGARIRVAGIGAEDVGEVVPVIRARFVVRLTLGSKAESARSDTTSSTRRYSDTGLI